MADVHERRKAFGDWLHGKRKLAGVTQAELARVIGFETAQMISNVERGVSLLPSSRLSVVAKSLGISLLELEIRFFHASARTSVESRMPDLLIKYLPLVELLEYGPESEAQILSVIERIKSVSNA